jgi:hypothetical protein
MNLPDLWRVLRPHGEGEGCRGCRHFRSDPAWLEAALPGLTILSSGHASVRDGDGLCLYHDCLTDGKRRCAGFIQESDVSRPN